MIRKIATVAAIAGAALTYTMSANAMDFPATPMNMGAPTNLPGETVFPGMRESMMIVNGVTQPILQPLLVPTAAPMAEPMAAPMHRRHHRHHMMMKRKMMMKHKMMMKQ